MIHHIQIEVICDGRNCFRAICIGVPLDGFVSWPPATEKVYAVREGYIEENISNRGWLVIQKYQDHKLIENKHYCSEKCTSGSETHEAGEGKPLK